MQLDNLSDPSGKGSMTRRDFVSFSLEGLTLAALPLSYPKILTSAMSGSLIPSSGFKIKAIAFDAFPIFDPRPVFTLVKELFPDKADELADNWRTRQFEYCWLRSMGGQYRDFQQVTEDALVFASKKVGVKLELGARKHLMDGFMKLEPWPDVIPSLQLLKKNNIRLCFLSNMSPRMLDSCIEHSDLSGYFEQVLSTDLAKTYKPDPKAYQLGVDALKLKKEEIVFAAFAGWDAAGAAWFGYPTFWVNRQGLPIEELSTIPAGTGKGMGDLVNFVLS